MHWHPGRSARLPPQLAAPRFHPQTRAQGRLDRIFARLKDWEPAAIELVGTQAIPGLERTVRLGKTERSDRSIRVWPSDHFGLHAVFIKKMG